MSDRGPYCGKVIAIATMHEKERAVRKPFTQWLGAEVIVATGIDTDAFGTFTGEVAREGTMLDASRAKANTAIETTGLPYGIGSEGSFGPHPVLPFVAVGRELLLFVDLKQDFVIHETVVTHRTNFSSRTCSPREDISAFLQSIGFPKHAVVVKPNSSTSEDITKGINTLNALVQAISHASGMSRDGLATIVTDMRAHMNPTRLAVIRALSTRLARRLATPCPACQAPGFGAVDVIRGLPCAWCEEPTQLACAELHRCAKCKFARSIPKLTHTTADPGQCQRCNP